MHYTVALFGEATEGRFQTAYHCRSLVDLARCAGEPPSQDCLGLRFAIRTLLYRCPVIFFRVREEGFSYDDYLFGLDFLKEREKFPQITALGIPGVGDSLIIEATTPIVELHKSLLILSESDLYDFLTSRRTDPS